MGAATWSAPGDLQRFQPTERQESMRYFGMLAPVTRIGEKAQVGAAEESGDPGSTREMLATTEGPFVIGIPRLGKERRVTHRNGWKSMREGQKLTSDLGSPFPGRVYSVENSLLQAVGW